MLHAARCKYRTQNYAKIAICAPSHDFCRAVFALLRHVSTIIKNWLNSNTLSICPHNMVNFGLLAAEIGWRVWGIPQQISTDFTSWLRYCTDITQWRSAKLCTMFGRLLGWYTIGYKVRFASKSCILLYWQRYCTALEEWASAKLSGVVSLRDRAAIPLGGRPVYLPSSLLTSRNG